MTSQAALLHNIRKTKQLTWTDKQKRIGRSELITRSQHAMQISEAPTLLDEPSRYVMKTMQENDTQRDWGKVCSISQKPGRRAEQSMQYLSQKPGGRAEQSRAEHAVYRRCQEEEQSRVLHTSQNTNKLQHGSVSSSSLCQNKDFKHSIFAQINAAAY